MAGGGDNGEMNPFISYVDLFSSVILVLLLFVLIMFVNVGYYMQFNVKIDSNQTIVALDEEKKKDNDKNEDNRYKEQKKEEYREQKKEEKQEEKQEDIKIQNEKTEENTLSKKSQKYAEATFVEADMVIAFKNNEYFLNKDIVRQTADVMQRILQAKPSTVFMVSIGDSKKLISSTQTKQVSLGRILSLKNNLDAIPELKGKVKINYISLPNG
jgi:energy-coupling factor transporter transmembrane protein EcfT